jgi:hypothetical protein
VIDVLRYSTDLTALGADKCATPCEEIDYLAWQNMNLLPSNIFPALIDTEEQEDEGDVAEEVDHEDLVCESPAIPPPLPGGMEMKGVLLRRCRSPQKNCETEQ